MQPASPQAAQDWPPNPCLHVWGNIRCVGFLAEDGAATSRNSKSGLVRSPCARKYHRTGGTSTHSDPPITLYIHGTSRLSVVPAGRAEGAWILKCLPPIMKGRAGSRCLPPFPQARGSEVGCLVGWVAPSIPRCRVKMR